MQSISSMTGFGRAELATDEYRVLAEIRSVNHRYLDVNLRMPRRFNCFESRIRSLLREYMQRGKADLYIIFEDYTAGAHLLKYNRELAAEYIEHFNAMAEEFGIKNDAGVSLLSRCPEVLTMEEASGDEERLWAIAEPVLREALSVFSEARRIEGGNLRDDLLTKLEHMESLVADIEACSPSVLDDYRERLSQKIRETLSGLSFDADEARILTETAVFADKICTDEEMVRLHSHIGTMREKLMSGGSCGRDLDFIAQEMNREANTTLSKSGSLRITDTAIALKSEIEKIREQVQNIE